MNEKIKEEIRKAGFSDKEATIYSYLAEHGGAYPSEIAEKTRLNRTTTYKILNELAVKGLVADIKKGKKLYYTAEPPKKFIRAAEYKVELAEDALLRANKILPELEGLFQLSENKPRVAFYEGKDRVMDAYITHVEVKKKYEMLAFASITDVEGFLPEKKYGEYVRLKDKMGITTRAIIPEGEFKKTFIEKVYGKTKKDIHPVFRAVPEKDFPFPAEITIYDTNKISIVKFDKKNPVAVIIADETIHNMMKKIFELAWIGAKYAEDKKK